MISKWDADITRKKLNTNIYHEHKHNNSQQNAGKLYPSTLKMDIEKKKNWLLKLYISDLSFFYLQNTLLKVWKGNLQMWRRYLQAKYLTEDSCQNMQGTQNIQ